MHDLAFRPYAAVVALSLLCCALFLPGIATLPVTDRDEARFAQASKQMVETGDTIDIRLQDKPRYKKPAGIYWLQAAAVTVATRAGAALNDIWAYRIPSFLGALGAVLLTFWAGRAILGREAALIASALFATTLMLSFEARIAKADAALIASITLSQAALFRLYEAPAKAATRGLATLFWFGLGAGILIKGPVALGLALLTSVVALAADARRGWLKNLHWRWGVPLLLLVTLPWLIAIGIASNGDFFTQSVTQDFAGKLQAAQEKHWGPPGFYGLAFLWTFWPAALFVTADTIRALWKMRRSRRIIFLFAWIVPFWLILEAIPTKLPHYALPLYPAIAMVAAFAMRSEKPPQIRVSAIIWGLVAATQITLLLCMSWIAEAPQLTLLAAICAIFAATAALTVIAAWRSYRSLALFGIILSGAVFYGAGYRIALPALEPFWISEKASAAAHALEGCGRGPAGFAGLNEISVVFQNGTDTLLTAPGTLADALATNQVRVAFVSWKNEHEFEQAFSQRAGHGPEFFGCVDGIDINGQGPVRLQVYVRPEAANAPGCAPTPAMACRPKDAVRWRRLLDTKF
ncbi:MAG TPA: glycosyltransferase family 39 protein [Geobacterales bacterium]|nr:glycosyltransferase family 39 protein [Geobacterales bacterium]